MALFTDIRPGESLDIDNGKIMVQFMEKAGKRTRVQITADRDISIKVLRDPNEKIRGDPTPST